MTQRIKRVFHIVLIALMGFMLSGCAALTASSLLGAAKNVARTVVKSAADILLQ